MSTDLNKRIRLRLAAQERMVFPDAPGSDAVASSAVELAVELGQAIGLGLETSTGKHFWFDIETRPLANRAADPDFGNPETDVWLAVRARTDWSAKLPGGIDLPAAEGTVIGPFSPGLSREVLARRIDGKDADQRPLSQVLVATITFAGALPDDSPFRAPSP